MENTLETHGRVTLARLALRDLLETHDDQEQAQEVARVLGLDVPIAISAEWPAGFEVHHG